MWPAWDRTTNSIWFLIQSLGVHEPAIPGACGYCVPARIMNVQVKKQRNLNRISMFCSNGQWPSSLLFTRCQPSDIKRRIPRAGQTLSVSPFHAIVTLWQCPACAGTCARSSFMGVNELSTDILFMTFAFYAVIVQLLWCSDAAFAVLSYVWENGCFWPVDLYWARSRCCQLKHMRLCVWYLYFLMLSYHNPRIYCRNGYSNIPSFILKAYLYFPVTFHNKLSWMYMRDSSISGHL